MKKAYQYIWLINGLIFMHLFPAVGTDEKQSSPACHSTSTASVSNIKLVEQTSVPNIVHAEKLQNSLASHAFVSTPVLHTVRAVTATREDDPFNLFQKISSGDGIYTFFEMKGPQDNTPGNEYNNDNSGYRWYNNKSIGQFPAKREDVRMGSVSIFTKMLSASSNLALLQLKLRYLFSNFY